MATPTRYTYLESPLGRILLAGGPGGLKAINFQDGQGALSPAADWEPSPEGLREAAEQIGAYFAGRLRTFELALDPGGTPFQRQVYRALQAIPYGETTSYGALARRLGRPNAARAVGAANGRNPLPIVVPCHRVIGNDGSLTGYYGGLRIKAFLLALEGGGRASPAQTSLLQELGDAG
jgi:methylated-DNA-[protein]-cysteine S-methyltransferase